MKKLTLPLIVTLMTLFGGTAHAWPETDHMNMCGAASKVIRDYKGNPKAWSNRDLYTKSRKAELYFKANCPETKAGKIEKGVTAKVMAQATTPVATPQPRPQPRLASCKDCFDAGYKKGYKDGHSVGLNNNPAASSSVTTPPMYRNPVAQIQAAAPTIPHGDHHHHTEVEKADCALTDALNRRAGPVVTVIKHH